MPSLIKKGWYWEDTLIEEAVPQEHFSISIDSSWTNVSQLEALGAGFIHLDMKVWGAPIIEDPSGNNVEITGMHPGKYEVYIAYFQSDGNVGQIVQAMTLNGGLDLLEIPMGEELERWILKMNAYICPYNNDQEYVFNDKAQGVNIYLKFVESYNIVNPITNDLYHICEINFEKGWRKIGDAIGSSFQDLNTYNRFLEIANSDYILPGIVSFTGGVGNTTAIDEVWSPFEFYSQPIISFYSSHGFTHDGVDKYRFKTAVIHNKRSWIGNVAKVKTKLDDEGLMQDNWGSIFEEKRDRLYKSAVRVYEEYPDDNWIDVATADGDEIIALKEFADLIFQFKKNKTYIIATGGGVESLVDTLNMGISYESSACVTPHGVCFFNKKGVYLHTGQGYVNLSKDKLDIEKFWYESQDDYYDIDYFVPELIYSPRDDKLILILQTFGDGITLEYLKENPGEVRSILGMPDLMDDGLSQGAESVLEALESFKDRTKHVLYYSFIGNSWTSSQEEALEGHKTNAIEYNGDIYIYNALKRRLIMWDATPRPQIIDIQTGFNTFEYPSMRKKIKNITISWKMDKGGIGTRDPQVEIKLYKDKNTDNEINLSADNIISGASYTSGRVLFDTGTDADDGLKMYITKIKLPSNANKVYSLSIRILSSTNVETQVGNYTHESFELDDISVIHQYMGVK